VTKSEERFSTPEVKINILHNQFTGYNIKTNDRESKSDKKIHVKPKLTLKTFFKQNGKPKTNSDIKQVNVNINSDKVNSNINIINKDSFESNSAKSNPNGD